MGRTSSKRYAVFTTQGKRAMDGRIRITNYFVAYVLFIVLASAAFAYQTVTNEMVNRVAVNYEIGIASSFLFAIGVLIELDAKESLKLNSYWKIVLSLIVLFAIPCASAIAFGQASFYGMKTHDMGSSCD
jgi:hypothetical protein